MNIPIRNVYHMLCYAWNYLDGYEAADLETAAWAGVPGLFAHVLSRLVSVLIRRGMHRAYLLESAPLRGVRGTIDVPQTVKRAARVRQELHCRFDELSHDTSSNRIIKAVLRLILRAEEVQPVLRSQIEALYRRLAHIAEVQLHGALFRSIQVHRNNRLYRFVLDVCRLVYESQLSSKRAGFVRFSDFRHDEHRMRRVFEEFVRSFYTHHGKGYAVNRPHLDWAGARGTEADLRRLPQMQTDLVLRSPGRYLIIDTKFTERTFQEHFGGQRFRSEHLYQMFAYLKNADWSSAAGGVACEGMVLYPAVGPAVAAELELSGTRLRIRSIDLDQDWPRIHHDLLDLVGTG